MSSQPPFPPRRTKLRQETELGADASLFIPAAADSQPFSGMTVFFLSSALYGPHSAPTPVLD